MDTCDHRQPHDHGSAPSSGEPGSGRTLLDDGRLRITRAGGRPWLTVAGEIDQSSYDGLLGALADVAESSGEVRIDLAAVSYCDLAGLRAFLLLAAGYYDGRRSRQVVLRNLSPYLKRVLQILGWDSAPGVIVE